MIPRRLVRRVALVPVVLAVGLSGGLGACGRSNPGVSAPDRAPEPTAELTATETTRPTPTGTAGYQYQAPNRSFQIWFPAIPDSSTDPWVSAHYDGGTRFYYARGDQAGPAIDSANSSSLPHYLQHVATGVALQFGAERVQRSEWVRSSQWPTLKFSFQNKRGIQYEARAIFRPAYSQLFVLVFGTTAAESSMGWPESRAFFQSFRPIDPVPSEPANSPDRPDPTPVD